MYWDSAESDTVFDATFQFELAGAKTYFIFIESDHESRSGNYISMTATEPVLDPMLTTSFNADSGLATITFTALADGQCLIARYNAAGQMQDCIACEARKGEATSISMLNCSIGDKIALFHVDQQYAPVCPSFAVMISQSEME